MDRTPGLAIEGHRDDKVVKTEELSKLKCLLGGREWDPSERAKRRSEEWDPIGPLISSRGGGNPVDPVTFVLRVQKIAESQCVTSQGTSRDFVLRTGRCS